MSITPANAGIVRVNRAAKTEAQLDSEKRQNHREEQAQKALESRCCSPTNPGNIWHCYWHNTFKTQIKKFPKVYIASSADGLLSPEQNMGFPEGWLNQDLWK